MLSTRILLQIFIVFYYINESSPKFWNALAALDPLKDQPMILKDTTRVNPSMNKELLQAQAQDRKFKIIKVLKKINRINRINPNFFKQKKKALKYISKKIPKYIKQFSKLAKKRPQGFFGKKKKRFPKKKQKCVPLKLFKELSDDFDDYEDDEDDDDEYDDRPVNNQHYNYFYHPPPYVYPMPIYHQHRRSEEETLEGYNRRNSNFTGNLRNFSNAQNVDLSSSTGSLQQRRNQEGFNRRNFDGNQGNFSQNGFESQRQTAVTNRKNLLYLTKTYQNFTFPQNPTRQSLANHQNLSNSQIFVNIPKPSVQIIPVSLNTGQGQNIHYDRFSNKDRIIPVVEASTENAPWKATGRNVLHANYSASKGLNTNRAKLNV